MDPVTHAAAGALISQVLPGPARGWNLLAGVLLSLLPDIDYFLILVDRLAFIRHHRGFTHSLTALPLLALAGAAVGRALGGPRWFRPLFFLGLAVVASHLILDLATSYGTQILFPFSRQRFTLDWLFIIDPYLTALLLAGAGAAIWSVAWGRQVAILFLAAAGAYFLLCGGYHHQALLLARQVFPESRPAQESCSPPSRHTLTLPGQVFPGFRGGDHCGPAPALFSPPLAARRRQLPGSETELRAVTLSGLPGIRNPSRGAGGDPPARQSPVAGCRRPITAPRTDLQVQVWTGLPTPDLAGGPEAQDILNRYLEFARFPLLRRVELLENGQLLEWLDLRFSIPGRDFPFALQLRLDARGRMQHWRLGSCGGEGQ